MSKCKKCGQDHKRAAACMGAKGGRCPKNSATQRANVMRRWAKYQASRGRFAPASRKQKRKGVEMVGQRAAIS